MKYHLEKVRKEIVLKSKRLETIVDEYLIEDNEQFVELHDVLLALDEITKELQKMRYKIVTDLEVQGWNKAIKEVLGIS